MMMSTGIRRDHCPSLHLSILITTSAVDMIIPSRCFLILPPSSSDHAACHILAIPGFPSGLCGSTCDTFTRTAWMYSKKNPAAPSFRYVTFGGTGKVKDIGGTRQVASCCSWLVVLAILRGNH